MFQTDSVDVFTPNVINLSLTEDITKSIFSDIVPSVTSGSTMATGLRNNSYRHIQTTDLPTIDNINESMQSNIGFDEMMNNIHGIIYDDSDYVVISLYIPVFIMALTANTMVIIVVFKYHYMRNVTNFFLVNLSIADLLVTLVCMPVAVSRSITYLWNYGFVLCKLAAYLQGVAVATSVFTITAMSIDRYLAITQPIGFPKLLNRKSATIVIMILWLISLIIFSPLLWVYVTEELPISPEDFFKTSNTSSQIFYSNNDTMNSSSFVNNNSLYKQFPEFSDKKMVFCREYWSNDFPLQRNVFGYICFILVYAIPGSIMVIAYSLMGRTLCSVRPPFDINEGRSSTQQSFRLVRERKRVAWILLLLAVLFAACWLPNNMITLLIDINGVENAEVARLHRFALLLGHANSAINPLLYCFMTKNFRRSVKELVFNTRRRWTTHQRRRQRQCQIRLIARFNTNKGTARPESGNSSLQVDRVSTMDAMYAAHARRNSNYKSSGIITNVDENRRDSTGTLLAKTSSGYDSYQSIHQKIPATPNYNNIRILSETQTSSLRSDNTYFSPNTQQMSLEVRKTVTVEIKQVVNSAAKGRKRNPLFSMFKRKPSKPPCSNDNIFLNDMTDLGYVKDFSSGKTRKRVEFL